MNELKSFLFGCTVGLCMLAVSIIPMCTGGCLAEYEPTHYYKIQRLSYNGEVIQTYYSKTYPWGTDYIDFKEYPSGKMIKLKCSYTAEDLGTNKPSL